MIVTFATAERTVTDLARHLLTNDPDEPQAELTPTMRARITPVVEIALAREILAHGGLAAISTFSPEADTTLASILNKTRERVFATTPPLNVPLNLDQKIAQMGARSGSVRALIQPPKRALQPFPHGFRT